MLDDVLASPVRMWLDAIDVTKGCMMIMSDHVNFGEHRCDFWSRTCGFHAQITCEPPLFGHIRQEHDMFVHV